MRHRLLIVLASFALAMMGCTTPSSTNSLVAIATITSQPAASPNPPAPTAPVAPTASVAASATPVRSGRTMPIIKGNPDAQKYVTVDNSACNDAHDSTVIQDATKKNLPAPVVSIIPLRIVNLQQWKAIEIVALPNEINRADIPSDAIWSTEIHNPNIDPTRENGLGTFATFSVTEGRYCVFSFWMEITIKLVPRGFQTINTIYTTPVRTGIVVKPILEFH